MNDRDVEPDDLLVAVEPYFNKLAAFQTADEIRDFLVGEGVRAVKGVSDRCAIAEYVRQGSGKEVEVWPHVSYRRRGGKRGYGGIVYRNTKAMAKFIENFDVGVYPELVKVV